MPSPHVLLGLDRPDDAGVYRLSDDLALIHTVDFFTPIVDDPFTYGRIAATNSLSDVYAMGGRPISALNVACFPLKTLDHSVLRDVFSGGLDALREADCPLIGGHTVDDAEFKYGLAVTGTVHPDRILSTAGARVGDHLVLTKPIGTGIVTTAHKRGLASEEAMAAAVRTMSTLNRSAADALDGLEVHACTDVTGFGLIGHAVEMVDDAATLVIRAGEVPLLPDILTLVDAGSLCGGLNRNRAHFAPQVAFDDEVPAGFVETLNDPQTSGGLLIALSPEEARELLSRLADAPGITARHIGEVGPAEDSRIRVTG